MVSLLGNLTLDAIPLALNGVGINTSHRALEVLAVVDKEVLKVRILNVQNCLVGSPTIRDNF
jgi:hypothetical protein